MNLQVLKHGFGRGLLLVKKNSPTILLATGIVSLGAGTVLACKATLKAQPVIQKMKTDLETVALAREKSEEKDYSKKDYVHDITIISVQTGVGLFKLYAPALGLGVLGLTSILGAHNILNKRNVALAAAYTVTAEAFEKYRGRVVDAYGKDVDYMFKHGLKKETVSTKVKDEETGKTKTVKEDILVSVDGLSQYAKEFNNTNRYWQNASGYNLMFLRTVQDRFNDLLQSRGNGIVFLNEVYEALGLEPTIPGQLVGWHRDFGDGYIDFGIALNHSSDELRRFDLLMQNGIILDFNVAGVVYDMLQETEGLSSSGKRK